MKIAVHIIESPSHEDLFEGRMEGRALSLALNLHGIPLTHRLVARPAQLLKAIRLARIEHETRFRGYTAAIHLACHASMKSGVQTTNRRSVPWSRLAAEFPKPGFGEGAWLCMSACEGLAALLDLAALGGGGIGWIVGSPSKPVFSETLVGFSTLYYQLHRGGVSFHDALVAMRTASMHAEFQIRSPAAEAPRLEALVRAMTGPAPASG